VVFPDLPGCTAMGHTVDEALRHAMEAAGEWAQAVSLPRPRLLEALRDDSCVKAALADGDGGSRSFERGKPGRGEYLASQPARWHRSARERPHMYAVLTFS
jgi:HicB_like antitoxin of bacterial toxin-antitoxin system